MVVEKSRFNCMIACLGEQGKNAGLRSVAHTRIAPRLSVWKMNTAPILVSLRAMTFEIARFLNNKFATYSRGIM